MTCAEARRLLDAYLDGELGIERALEVDRHIETCAGCAAELARRRALGGALRERLEYHPAPLELQRALRLALPRTTSPWLRLAASFLAVAIVSSAATYYGVPRGGGDVVGDEVFASYVRGMQFGSGQIDVASSDEHTVKPWLDAHLDFAVPVKDLSRDGFVLTGGRLDYIAGHRVAALVYSYSKHVITVFVWPSDGDARPLSLATRRGDHLAHWSDGAMTYWAISDLAAPEFSTFCQRFAAADMMPEGPSPARP